MPVKDVKEGLTNMVKSFNPAAAAGWKCAITMDIVGDKKYNVNIANQKCAFGEGPAPKPDLTITVSKADWMAISNGQLNAVAAFMSGKLKSQGDMSNLMKLQTVFKLG
jgi:putative sterol carrier protein